MFPLNTCYWVLLLEFIIYFFIAVYLDNVLPDKNGERGPRWTTCCKRATTTIHQHTTLP